MREPRTEQGFTLVEVTIAISSAAILALGVMMVFATSSKQDRIARQTTTAQNACAAYMEFVESFDFDQLALFAGQTVEIPNPAFMHQVNVEQIEADLLAISVTTVPEDDETPPVRLTTLMAIKETGL